MKPQEIAMEYVEAFIQKFQIMSEYKSFVPLIEVKEAINLGLNAQLKEFDKVLEVRDKLTNILTDTIEDLTKQIEQRGRA